MIFNQTNCISLGVVDKPSGIDRNGNAYEGYACFNYVIEGEQSSRKFYLPKDNRELEKNVRKFASIWGMPVVITGDIDSNGRITILTIEGGEIHG